MFKQIRSMLAENDRTLSGKVEADETYVGGKMKGGKRGRGSENKTIVAGVVERKGAVIARVVPDVKAKTLIPFIQEKVLPETMIFTDEFPSYNQLSNKGYGHERVFHAQEIYVIGEAHTNSLEGFWSLVKTGFRGVYHQVSPKYLQTYVNEYAFRYTRRFDTTPMFLSFLSQVRKSCD